MLLLLLALSTDADAGACCVGSTSTVPTTVGECETWMAGLGIGGQTSFGQWTSGGEVASSSLQDDAVIATVAAGWRWDRKGQIGLSLPARINRKATEASESWGGGAGDVRIIGRWDPVTELPRGSEGGARMVPVAGLGLRLPTGRSWTESDTAMLEDVTGLPGPAVILSVAAERTLDRTPWSFGLDSELGAEGGRFHPALTAWINVGRSLGTAWSINGSLLHSETFVVDSGVDRTARTSAGAKLVHGKRLKHRVWAGIESDLPVPGLGTGNLQQLSGSVGFAVVR